MFEIAAVQKDANLVELEKCCQTHLYMQNFVLIQPRTSPPNTCKILRILRPESSLRRGTLVAPGAAAGEDLRPREAHVELHLGCFFKNPRLEAESGLFSGYTWVVKEDF